MVEIRSIGVIGVGGGVLWKMSPGKDGSEDFVGVPVGLLDWDGVWLAVEGGAEGLEEATLVGLALAPGTLGDWDGCKLGI